MDNVKLAMMRLRKACVSEDEVEAFACITKALEVAPAQQATNTGSPKLPLVERAFRDGFITGHFPVSVDVAWKEWQLRAGA